MDYSGYTNKYKDNPPADLNPKQKLFSKIRRLIEEHYHETDHAIGNLFPEWYEHRSGFAGGRVDRLILLGIKDEAPRIIRHSVKKPKKIKRVRIVHRKRWT